MALICANWAHTKSGNANCSNSPACRDNLRLFALKGLRGSYVVASSGSAEMGSVAMNCEYSSGIVDSTENAVTPLA